MAMSALKVSPSKLNTKAGEFSKDASNLKKVTDQMFTTINQLSGAVWSGDAATAYKNQFKKLDDDTKRMVKLVKEFSSDLQTIAKEYEKAEKANESTSKSLKADVIS